MPPDEKPQGNQAHPGQGEGDPPKYVTEEQLNRAITARFGDFQKKLDKQIEGLTTSIVGKVEEVVTGKLESLKPQGGTPTGDGKPPIDDSPKVKGLEKQIQELQAKTKQAEEAAAAEKAKARDTALRQRLGDDLTKGGVDPRYVKAAVGNLVDVEKRVRFVDDTSDEIVFRDATGDLDLATGLKGWLKGDDAKIYLPPRGTQGAGDRPGSKPTSPGPQPMSAGKALLGMAMNVMQGNAGNEG